eukprot:1152840-Pelagomonas_calceolata.AAC.1
MPKHKLPSIAPIQFESHPASMTLPGSQGSSFPSPINQAKGCTACSAQLLQPESLHTKTC